MKIPTIKGIIDRRILVNYRVDPIVLQKLLPAPFRPQIVNGMGIAGICLIRLNALHPRWLPPLPGWSSENAAHRIAVEWNQGDSVRTGVFIPRRDTNSWTTVTIGGRLFPGVHHHARFDVHENQEQINVTAQSDDRQMNVEVKVRLCDRLTTNSIFHSLEQASNFFEAGSVGYSPNSNSKFDGLKLHTSEWRVEPLEIESLQSSFFDDPSRFRSGSAEFDCALLMRNVRHEWRVEPTMSTNLPS